MSGAKSGWRFGSRSDADEVVAGHDLSDRTLIVTGANTGIGFETARALASAGARVILACRQTATGQAAVDRIRALHPNARAEAMHLDLASFASIRAFVERLDAPVIDALVCNAGLAVTRYEETAEGFEKTLGVCHIGHFLLTRLLMPRLLAAPQPRLVVVSSESHRMPPRLDFARLPMTAGNFRGLVAYGQAKLCNVLFAKALQRRYGARGLVACALHPGTLVTTDIGRYSGVFAVLMKLVSPFTKTPSQGAATSVEALVHEPASELAGVYLSHCRPVACTAEADDPAVADRLWALSEDWVASAAAPPWPADETPAPEPVPATPTTEGPAA
ncbi:MAG: SDR family oxidoreductase [Pseudomonadales bacterium]|jgi:WW domain-containing oxidoreductase|nr:SDR family oxidoreductase [Pseudomonadales bacterium]